MINTVQITASKSPPEIQRGLWMDTSTDENRISKWTPTGWILIDTVQYDDSALKALIQALSITVSMLNDKVITLEGTVEELTTTVHYLNSSIQSINGSIVSINNNLLSINNSIQDLSDNKQNTLTPSDSIVIDGSNNISVKLSDNGNVKFTITTDGIQGQVDGVQVDVLGTQLLDYVIAEDYIALTPEDTILEAFSKLEKGLQELEIKIDGIIIDGDFLKYIEGNNAAIRVSTKADNKQIVQLYLNTNDKILKQSPDGLQAFVTIQYNPEDHKLYLYGKDNIVLGTADMPNYLNLKEATIVKDPEGELPGTYVKLTFESSTGDQVIYLAVDDLVDLYESGNKGIDITNNLISLVVDAESPLSIGDNGLTLDLSNYVKKEEGKGLSSNDYTTVEKDKLAMIENGANKYVLPQATPTILGGVYKASMNSRNTVDSYYIPLKWIQDSNINLNTLNEISNFVLRGSTGYSYENFPTEIQMNQNNVYVLLETMPLSPSQLSFRQRVTFFDPDSFVHMAAWERINTGDGDPVQSWTPWRRTDIHTINIGNILYANNWVQDPINSRWKITLLDSKIVDGCSLNITYLPIKDNKEVWDAAEIWASGGTEAGQLEIYANNKPTANLKIIYTINT